MCIITFRKSIRESTTSSTAAGGATLGHNMIGSTASASASYRRPTDINSASMTASTVGATTNNNVINNNTDGNGDIKPRSLRFTWSMKTTSSMDPSDMMKEIRKVIFEFI